MKRIIRLFNLYEYHELPSHVRPVALQHIYDQMYTHAVQHDCDDMKKSVEAFLDRFLLKAPLLTIDVEEDDFTIRFADAGFSFLSEGERRALVERINGSYVDETDGKCSLTGVFTDCYLFDYFKENGATSGEMLGQDIKRATCFGLKKFIHDMSTDLSTEATLVEYGRDHDLLYFTKDGQPYQKTEKTSRVMS